MLDVRLYRAAFVPVVVAVLIAAFSLGERPRPIRTTLAPDAFDGQRAYAGLLELARTYPRRAPGSPGDEALADRVQADLDRAGFAPRRERFAAETVDGEQTLETVIGERVGRDSRRIVIVAQRDAPADDRGAAGDGGAARLSGTAALLELARLYRGRATRRTLTLVSTSGATGGSAGVRDLVDRLGGPVDAVVVLGDLAGRTVRRPVVVPWSESAGIAPMRLRRTVEEAVRAETDLDPGAPRALVQLARLAVPLTLTAQGPLGAGGLPAVTLQASGERGPPPGAEVSRGRLQAFGRATLRSISALDNGPDVPAGPREYVIAQRQVVPRWTVALLGGALLLPLLVAAVDGLARVRRRRGAVGVWLRWLAAGALPFVLCALVMRVLGLAGAVPPLAGAVDPAVLAPDGAVLALAVLVLVLGLLVRGPAARALGARSAPRPDDVPGAAAAIAVVLAVVAIAVWAVNPYTALLAVPAAHLWLLVAVPEVRVPRALGVALVLAGLVPLALVALYYAGQFGLGPLDLAWMGVLLLAGGTAGPLGVLAWSLLLSCALGAVLTGWRAPRGADEPGGDEPVRIRGPLSYAGPGSLGGTSSALRR
jgi:hypothetical protein